MFSSHKTTKSELVPNRGWVRICLLFAILYNVAGHPEADTSALSTFNDKNQVAAYAVNGFAWAVSNKVVGGTSNTTLSPSGTATRAQDCSYSDSLSGKCGGRYVPGGHSQPAGNKAGTRRCNHSSV